jgi:hypothetical protein
MLKRMKPHPIVIFGRAAQFCDHPPTTDMGIPMEDIHTPSVASGLVSDSYANGVFKDGMTFDQLIAEKARLEGELKALSAVLDSVL